MKCHGCGHEFPNTSARCPRCHRSTSNIVEGALTRVKRASKNASRAALPKIEPARAVQAATQVSLAVDRQATARALDPAPEIESRADFTPAPRPEVVQSSIVKPP